MPAPIPVCLTVAGSDSGGGAGIQADLRTFHACGTYGASAITCVTAQNPQEVAAVHAVPAAIVARQIRTVVGCYTIGAIKTGMLFNCEIIHALAAELPAVTAPIVVDPVMVATSGGKLLQDDAVAAMRREVLPLAELITPNRAEAEVLLGRPITDAAAAARELAARCGKVLLKGGHGAQPGVDFLAAPNGLWRLTAPPLDPIVTHGTGCTLSSAVAAHLARGKDLLDAVCAAKLFVWASLQNPRTLGTDVYGLYPPAAPTAQTIDVEQLA